MQLIYEGVDITQDVQIRQAEVQDVSCGRADSMELVLENAKIWHRWQPNKDDRIELRHKGYSTGEMYLTASTTEDGKYHIIATAAKSAANRKSHASYKGMSLQRIMDLCGAECGMDYRIYGMDPGMIYAFLVRDGESSPAFLARIAEMEGAMLKTYAGRFTMIDILTAQKLPAMETMEINADMPGIYYQRTENQKIKTFVACTTGNQVSAQDTAVLSGKTVMWGNCPARQYATAGRWARGRLLTNNRKAEKLVISSDFRGAWTAMVRVDVRSDAGFGGKWIADEVTHDFVSEKSSITLLKCVETVM